MASSNSSCPGAAIELLPISFEAGTITLRPFAFRDCTAYVSAYEYVRVLCPLLVVWGGVTGAMLQHEAVRDRPSAAEESGADESRKSSEPAYSMFSGASRAAEDGRGAIPVSWYTPFDC